MRKTLIDCRERIYTGETLVEKLKRAMTTREPIDAGAPPIYTEEEIKAEHNIRIDPREQTMEASQTMHKVQISQATGAPKKTQEETKE